MTAYAGTVTDLSGSFSLANENLLELIKTNMEAEGWTTLLYDTGAAPKELIMQGDGLSATEDIYVGFRSFQSVAADYYNITLAVFDGYVGGNSFVTQPGYQEVTLCAHNTSISYWMIVNGQRIAMGLKVGTPVYDSGYAGKYLPYANPTQHPYPVCLMGPLSGASATRYSDTTRHMPFIGASYSSNLFSKVRDLNGIWLNTNNGPWASGNYLAFSDVISERDTNLSYHVNPVVLATSLNGGNVWGELDGVFHISGFNNSVENTLLINSINYVVLQNIYRTGFRDYIALRLD